jgi:hypothetical protein
MTSLLNFIKIYQLVQKLLRETDRHTNRQTSDLISLTFLFKESRLIKTMNLITAGMQYEKTCQNNKVSYSFEKQTQNQLNFSHSNRRYYQIQLNNINERLISHSAWACCLKTQNSHIYLNTFNPHKTQDKNNLSH